MDTSLPTPKTRVAAVSWGVRTISHVDEFFQHCNSLTLEAVRGGANIVVFPELFEVELLSLFGDGAERDVVGHLLPFYDKLDEHLKQLAISHNIVIVGGSYLRPHTKGTVNASTIAWNSGALLYQPKNCSTAWEKHQWKLHSEMGLQQLPDPRLGVLICYDSEFPEAARALAENGVELLCVPSYCESQHSHQRVLWSSMARAVENEQFVVHTSLVGPIERFSLGTGYGRSTIIAPCKDPFPDSGFLAQSALNEESVAIADISFEDLALCRTNGDARPWSDRKVSNWPILT